MGYREGAVGCDSWVEVLNEHLGVTWAWDGETLAAFVFPIGDDVHVTPDTMEAVSAYADDKEFDLLMERLHDESGFEGTPEEFARAYARGDVDPPELSA